jgi:hypothetical protein
VRPVPMSTFLATLTSSMRDAEKTAVGKYRL